MRLSLSDSHDGFSIVVGNVPFGFTDEKKRSEVLFLERCLDLVEFRTSVIVPDSTLACTRDKPIRVRILANFGYRATISISSGKNTIFYNSAAKTSIMIIDRHKPKGNYKIFMAIAEKTEELELVKGEWLKFLSGS